jgi:hypothetical protein
MRGAPAGNRQTRRLRPRQSHAYEEQCGGAERTGEIGEENFLIQLSPVDLLGKSSDVVDRKVGIDLFYKEYYIASQSKILDLNSI